jgi:hypothetical protein
VIAGLILFTIAWIIASALIGEGGLAIGVITSALMWLVGGGIYLVMAPV